MKRIVFVIDRLFGGGAERVTATLMSELCKDAQIHLLETFHHDPNDDYPIRPEIVKHVIGQTSNYRVKLMWERVCFIRTKISEINPCCIVSLASSRTSCLIMAATLGSKIPVILSERNDPRRNPTSRVFRILRRYIYWACNGLVFQTTEARDFFPKSIRNKSVVIGNPITAVLPEPYKGVKEHRIINCCRLVPQKNLDLLIDAFVEIADEYPCLSLVVFGEGSERARLEEKIENLGLHERILLPGYTPNVHEELKRSLMFVSSSDYEGISNSMIEAIAIGVPTICTDCPAGGAREVIRNEYNGLLVPVGDCKAMAVAMRRVLEDSELAERLGRNGTNLREELSASIISQKWRDYIFQIVKTKRV